MAALFGFNPKMSLGGILTFLLKDGFGIFGFNVVGILEKWRILAEISWKNGINIIFLSWKSGNNQLNFIGKEEV